MIVYVGDENKDENGVDEDFQCLMKKCPETLALFGKD